MKLMQICAGAALAAMSVSGWAQTKGSPTDNATTKSGVNFGRNQGAIFDNAPIIIPSLRREMRAVWVATVFNIDWPTANNQSNATQQAGVIAMLDAMVDANMNAVFLQVRSQACALYQSTLEPWAACLRGSLGTAPNPVYDPLQFWITEARKRGIEVYAWFNPYRALTSSSTVAPTSPVRHVRRFTPSVTDVYGSQVWIDPSSPTGSNHSRNVILDVVTRYDIDGVVFDDYFYPYPITNVAYPDSDAYAAYTGGGGQMSLAEWRRSNVDNFVQSVGQQIKAIKPEVKYGIGPFGIWQPNNPPGVAGLNAYASLYADSRKWLQQGWVDFLAPQLYWRISAAQQPYVDLLEWWASPIQNPLGRNVYASNNSSNLLDNTWPASEIVNQVSETRNVVGASGNVFYSAKTIRDNTQSLRTLLKANLYAQPSLIPPHPWIDSVAPSQITTTYTYSRVSGTHAFFWTHPDGVAPAIYVTAALIGNNWTFQVHPSTKLNMVYAAKNSGNALRVFGVAAMDRSGNLSPWRQLVLDPSAVSNFGRD